MESRRHPHGQPLYESAASPTHVVLPSVAQLIASSSTPSTGSVPAYHQPSSSLPPLLRSTPHSPPPIAPSANAPSPTEQLHQRHTSRASPTGSASSMSERSYHHQSSVQYQPPQGGVTFHGSHPEADLHRPANARRQDSAISPLIRPDTAKEASSLVRPSAADLSSARRSPNSSHHPTVPTNSGHVLLHSSAPGPPAMSHEHVTTSLNSSHTHPPPELAHRTQSPPRADSSHSSTARQPRFNVRFATNHTPENMPSVHRPRHTSPPSVTVPPPEPVDATLTPEVEPVRPAVNSRLFSILLGHQTDHAESSPETHEGPERCSGCNEAWKPTLIHHPPSLSEDKELEHSGGLQQQHEKMARVLEANREKLEQYNKENNEAFEQWKKAHSRCLIVPAKPPQNGNSTGPSNKRKPEAPHGDVSKRRAMPNRHAITAPSVQSSTSA